MEYSVSLVTSLTTSRKVGSCNSSVNLVVQQKTSTPAEGRRADESIHESDDHGNMER